LGVKPRRGRVELATIDPSEKKGVTRRHIDDQNMAHEDHVCALQECLHAEGTRSVLIAKVRELAPPAVIDRRYGLINRFEAEIVKNGTTLVKLFLHISPEEQRRRRLARLKEPDKRWSSAAATSASVCIGTTTRSRTVLPSGVAQLQTPRGTSFPPTARGTGTGPCLRFSSRRWRR
jgi:hypothetical protein